MSITNLLTGEEIALRENKEYRKAVKARLQELVKEGDADAIKEYDRLFPKLNWSVKDKHEEQYKARVLGRKQDRIPYIVCKTCGKICDRVQEFEDPTLRTEKRKTWKRTIKPNLNYYLYLNNRKLRNRRLFFAYPMMSCIAKKHKLQIKFKEHKTIVEMGYDYLRSKAK